MRAERRMVADRCCAGHVGAMDAVPLMWAQLQYTGQAVTQNSVPAALLHRDNFCSFIGPLVVHHQLG
jgi:hypothetical protein